MGAWLFLFASLLIGGWFLWHRTGQRVQGSNLIGWLFLALGMTSPLILYPTRLMLSSGTGPDAYIGIWNLWWTKTALLSGANPLDTNLLYHPNGTSLALHTFSLTYGIISAPLLLLCDFICDIVGTGEFGPVDGLCLVNNILLVLSFTLSAYFIYRLSLAVGGNRTGAIIGAFVFAFINFRFANTVRLHVIATEFLLLSVWAWHSLLRRPTGKQLAAWLGSLILLVYASLELTAYGILLHFLFAFTLRGQCLNWLKQIFRAAFMTPSGLAAVGGAILLLLPLVLGIFSRLAEGGAEFNPVLANFFSADLIDFLLPNQRHPIWGQWAADISSGFHQGDRGFGVSIGWPAIVLFVIASIALLRKGTGRLWIAAFFVFIMLALGPELRVKGISVFSGIMPYDVATTIFPWLSGSRTPIRFLLPAALFLSLTISVGWATLARDGQATFGKLTKPIELSIMAVLAFAALSIPLPMVDPEVGKIYSDIIKIKSEESWQEGALIHIPGLSDREELLAQTVHECPILADVDNAMPLRSNHVEDPFEMHHWRMLTRQFSNPNLLSSLSPEKRSDLITGLKEFIERFGVRWIVLRRTRFSLSPDGKSIREMRIMDERQYAAFREHVRLLAPVREIQRGSEVLFVFNIQLGEGS